MGLFFLGCGGGYFYNLSFYYKLCLSPYQILTYQIPRIKIHASISLKIFFLLIESVPTFTLYYTAVK